MWAQQAGRCQGEQGTTDSRKQRAHRLRPRWPAGRLRQRAREHSHAPPNLPRRRPPCAAFLPCGGRAGGVQSPPPRSGASAGSCGRSRAEPEGGGLLRTGSGISWAQRAGHASGGGSSGSRGGGGGGGGSCGGGCWPHLDAWRRLVFIIFLLLLLFLLFFLLCLLLLLRRFILLSSSSAAARAAAARPAAAPPAAAAGCSPPNAAPCASPASTPCRTRSWSCAVCGSSKSRRRSQQTTARVTTRRAGTHMHLCSRKAQPHSYKPSWRPSCRRRRRPPPPPGTCLCRQLLLARQTLGPPMLHVLPHGAQLCVR